MQVRLTKGNKTVLTDHVLCYRLYGYATADNRFAADVVIELDHNGLLKLIRKAEWNTSKRTKDGPVTIKLANIQGPEGGSREE
jgi:hypothetical protein